MVELIAELGDRLGRLIVLAPPTVELVLEMLQEGEPDDVRYYVDTFLPMLEAMDAESRGMPHIVAIARRVADLPGRDAVAEEFGLQDYNYVGWLRAVKREVEPARLTVCMANMFAFITFGIASQEQTPNVSAMRMCMEARFLALLGKVPTVVDRFEAWLGLSTERYQGSGLSDDLARRLDGVSMEVACQIIFYLADGLADAGRHDDRRRLVEGFLGIVEALYDDRDALGDHLERWRAESASQIADFYDPELLKATDFLQGIGSFESFFAKLVRSLSWCLYRQGDPARGATLYGAYLGVWPDEPGALSTLRRRIEGLGREAALEHLTSWTSLVERAGQRESLRYAFERTYGVVADDRDRAGARRPWPNPRWSGEEANAASLLMHSIVSSLNEDAPEQVVALYCACSGVSEEDLAEFEPDRELWLGDVEPAFADPLVLAIACAFHSSGRFEFVVAMLESYYDLPGDEYRTTRLRSTLAGRRERMPLDRRMNVVIFMLWSTSLSFTNRVFEAFLLLPEFYPGLTGAFEDFGAFLADLKELPADASEFIAYLTARVLHTSGLPARSRRLIGAHLGLDVEGPGCAWDEIGRLIRSEPHRLDKHKEFFVFHFAATLVDEWPDRAVALFEGYTGLRPDDYDDRARLKEGLSAITPVGAADFPPIWSLGLAGIGRPTTAVRYLEAVLSWETVADYSWDNLLRRTASMHALVGNRWSSRINAFEFAGNLLGALQRSGEFDKRRALLESLAADEDWFESVPPGGLLMFYVVAGDVLLHLQECDPERCLEICSRTVDMLRREVNRPYLSGPDRIRLAGYTAAFRREVTAVGNALIARQADPERADALRRQFLCWEAELGQRVVLERFLSVTPAVGSDGGAEPIPGDAYRGRDKSFPGLPPYLAPLGCFDSVSDAEPVPRVPEEDAGPTLTPADHEEFLAALRRGVREIDLAEVLGSEKMLLRAGFTQAGQLIWALFDADDRRLRTVCHGRTPVGRDARGEMRDAVKRHDVAIHAGWEQLRLGQFGDELGRHAGRLAGLIERSEWALAATYLGQLEGRMAEHRLAGTLQRLRRRFPGLARGEMQADPAAVAEDWRAFWADAAGERLDAAGLEARLDAATASLLDEVAASWPLEDLAAALDARPDADLLVQVEDVLHSVPLAFLCHGGRYLFERARSMHSVLSLSLVTWLRDLDHRALRASQDEPDKLLSLSWFDPADRGARRGADLLHEGHRRIARKLAGAGGWYVAADEPPGSHSCLMRALEVHRAFRVVSVCGHGRSDLSGIELGDGVWNGSSLLQRQENSWHERAACDLLGIELLIQVSCSIGRVRQSDLQDVDGFCVELAVHRARSVLAGLWPLHSLHSPAFAGAVAAGYLRLRREAVRGAAVEFETLGRHAPGLLEDEALRSVMAAQSVSGACLRARALAAARLQWLDGHRAGRRSVGLNTVAAFELYGLG